jgi:lipoprotein NlpD
MNKMASRGRAWNWMGLVLACALLAGCAAPRRAPAPVEDRGMSRPATTIGVPAEAPRVLPGAENAGKPGYYTVRPGDTLVRIALESGQNWRDVARWNNIDNPNVLEAGQVIRIAPPAGAVAVAPAAPSSAPAAALPPASAPSSAASATRAPATAVPSTPRARGRRGHPLGLADAGRR